jgi:integrase
MNQLNDFFHLFNQFIAESQSGKRLKKDGSKIRSGSISHYISVRNELLRFCKKENFILRIRNIIRIRKRELKSEKIYWKRFYRKYSDYLYSIGCFDNYVGAHFKVIRTFFSYLKQEKAIFAGDFHKCFYVRNENVPIIVISSEQLRFLIYDADFENTLSSYLKETKNIFVFGCTVGLRFSDLMNLTNKNIKKTSHAVYLCVRSGKTSTDTRIKLPDYAIQILKKYSHLKTLIPHLSNNRLNLNLKELCEKAGWTHEAGKQRERRGVVKKVNKNGKAYRFCDLITTHTMRRTAITTFLSLGMPEIMVRKLSGHAANSKEFYRYVNYAQHFIDQETDRIYTTLIMPEKSAEIC